MVVGELTVLVISPNDPDVTLPFGVRHHRSLGNFVCTQRIVACARFIIVVYGSVMSAPFIVYGPNLNGNPFAFVIPLPFTGRFAICRVEYDVD